MAQLAEFAVLRGDPEAAAALGADAVDGLLAALRHRSSWVRQTGLEALRQVPDPRALDAIAACMRDDHVGVRDAAVSALAAIDDGRATDLMVGAVTQPGLRSRAVVDALSGSGDQRAVTALSGWLRSGGRKQADPVTRRHA